MIDGVFRNGLPRVTLTIPGLHEDVETEFIVDTGFDGDLALPARTALRLGVPQTSVVYHTLASGDTLPVPILEIALPWGDEDGPRLTA